MNEPSSKSVRAFLAGHSKPEKQLTAYITLLFIVASGIFVYTDLRATLPTTKHVETTVRQQGGTSTAGSQSDPTPMKYVNETSHGHDFQVTLNFDPNAQAQVIYDAARKTPAGTYDGGLDELNITGKAIGSSKTLIVTVIARNSAPTIPKLSSQGMQAAGIATAFKTTIMGKQYTTYYYDLNNQQLVAFVPVGGLWYSIEIQSHIQNVGQGYAITQALAEPILNSISIQ